MHAASFAVMSRDAETDDAVVATGVSDDTGTILIGYMFWLCTRS
jgi:hypothetical protein